METNMKNVCGDNFCMLSEGLKKACCVSCSSRSFLVRASGSLNCLQPLFLTETVKSDPNSTSRKEAICLSPVGSEWV